MDPDKKNARFPTLPVFLLAVFVILSGMSSTNRTKINGANKKKMPNAVTLEYRDILFIAPNEMNKPFHVIAKKGNKTLWEIDRKAVPVKKQDPALQDGGVEKLEIKTLKESDLDSGAPDFAHLKTFIGKPALFIQYSRMTVVNRLPSWTIVDVETGEKIGFIAFN